MLYPGNTTSSAVLGTAVGELERILALTPRQRAQVCLRLDGGVGTDANLAWALQRGYQLIAKNNSGRRAGTWGRQVATWQVVVPDRRWVGVPPYQLAFPRPTRTVAVRWADRRGQMKHALYIVTDLQSSLVELCHAYDLRGGAEVDIRNDKQGLLLTHRRKRGWHAQEILVLLNDVAHNFLSALRARLFCETPLAGFGPYRLIQEVLCVPGEVIVEQDQLVELRLLRTHPHAAVLAEVLPKLWQ